MDARIKKELEKNLNAINSDFSTIINGQNLTSEVIKNGFSCIRILIDYCEELALGNVDFADEDDDDEDDFDF